MKKTSHNGSIGNLERYQAAQPKYHTYVKNPAETNLVKIGLKDEDGNIVTNINFLVIKPADLIKVRVVDDINLKEKSFWHTVLVNQSLTFIILFIFIALIGWRNVKSLIEKLWK